MLHDIIIILTLIGHGFTVDEVKDAKYIKEIDKVNLSCTLNEKEIYNLNRLFKVSNMKRRIIRVLFEDVQNIQIKSEDKQLKINFLV